MFSKKKDDFRRYVDTSGGMSNKDLAFASWFAQHRHVLEMIGLSFLIAWCVATIGFSLVMWGNYLIFGIAEDNAMQRAQVLEMPNYARTHHLFSAQELKIGNTSVFEGAGDKYDFVTDVTNPNKRWIAYLTYKYTYGGGETQTVTTPLMPGENRPIALFGHDIPRGPLNVRLVIDSVAWKKVTFEMAADPAAFLEERQRFAIENIAFTRASAAQGLGTHRIEFDFTNESAYSYWSPTLYVELLGGLSGTNRQGLAFFPMEKFRSGETRHIDVRSFTPQLDVTNIQVFTVMDLFDTETYMAPGT